MQTPETGDLNTDPDRLCLWFSVGYYTIRWDDNTLTSGRFLIGAGRLGQPDLPCSLRLSDLRAR